jgi:hypothetical protein
VKVLNILIKECLTIKDIYNHSDSNEGDLKVKEAKYFTTKVSNNKETHFKTIKKT